MSHYFLDKDGNLVGPFDFNETLGRKSATNTRSFNLSSEDKTALDFINTNLGILDGRVDGLEAAVASTNTKLDTLNTTVSDATPNPVRLAGDRIVDGTTLLTPKFAKIAASASGPNTIVAAVAGKKIRVLAYNFIGNGAVNAKFRSATATDLTGLKYIAAAGGGIAPGFNPLGWFETTSGEALTLDLSAAVAVGGELVYVEV